MKDRIAREAPDQVGDLIVLGPWMQVDRDSRLAELLETLSELNAWVGVIASVATSSSLRETLPLVQHDLCHMCDQIGVQSGPLLSREHLARIDEMIARLEPAGETDEYDVLPPGGPLPATLANLGRTVCRRAQRQFSGLRRLNNAIGASGLRVLSDDITPLYLERLETLLRLSSEIETL